MRRVSGALFTEAFKICKGIEMPNTTTILILILIIIIIIIIIVMIIEIVSSVSVQRVG
jgi:hypothetical protein